MCCATGGPISIGTEASRYGLDDYLAIKYVCQGGLA